MIIYKSKDGRITKANFVIHHTKIKYYDIRSIIDEQFEKLKIEYSEYKIKYVGCKLMRLTQKRDKFLNLYNNNITNNTYLVLKYILIKPERPERLGEKR